MGSWEEWAELSPRAGRQAGSLEKPATARVQRSRPLLFAYVFLLRIREASQLWLAAPRLRDSQAGGRKGGGEQEMWLSCQLTSQMRYPGSGMVCHGGTLFQKRACLDPSRHTEAAADTVAWAEPEFSRSHSYSLDLCSPEPGGSKLKVKINIQLTQPWDDFHTAPNSSPCRFHGSLIRPSENGLFQCEVLRSLWNVTLAFHRIPSENEGN